MIIEIYTPGTPGTPGTPARYVNVDAKNWSSGSVSIPLTVASGGYKFKVPVSVAGVHVGIVGVNDYPGSGYLGIPHALYFSRGAVHVYESGQKIGELPSYVSGDEFTITRQNGRVWFGRNGVKEFDRPTRVQGTFRLAATQFLTGDKVVDAAVLGVLDTIGVGFAGLRPLTSAGFETAPANWGVAEFEPLTASGSVDGHAQGTTTLAPLTAAGSDRNVAQGRANLAPIRAEGEAGMLSPDFGHGLAVLSGMATRAHMIPGGIGVGYVRLHKLLGLGSDRPIAQAHNELSPMFAWGAEGITLRGSALTTRDRYKVRASGRQGSLSAAQLTGPALTMAGLGGASAQLTGPRLTLSATGTVPNIARVNAVLPTFTLVASGTVSGAARLAVELPGGFKVVARTGAIAVLTTKSAYSVNGIAVTIERAEARLTGPGRFAVVAGGQREGVATAVLTGPALIPAPSGQAWLVGPRLTMYAVGGEVVAAAQESYAINLTTGAVSHYTNYPFDNIVRFGDRFYGIKADGVFALEGNTDDGAPIQTNVTTFMTDFGSQNNKRVLWVYLLGRLDDGMHVTVHADEGLSYTYRTDGANDGTMRTHRAKVGRGLKGNYFSFTFENVDGADFEIDHVDVIRDVLTRAR